jgi:hypothetical protein
MAARFVPNPAGIRAMTAAPPMIAALDRKGKKMVNFAKLTGPYRTGNYSRSWRIYSGVRNGKAWCRVVNQAHYAAFLEFGTKHMRRQRVLGRAIIAARR